MATALCMRPTRARSYPVLFRLAITAFFVVQLAATLFCLHIFDQRHDLLHNDLAGRQFATREALLHHSDPYSAQMRHEIQDVTGHDKGQGFDYPLLLAVLIAPVAWVPWPALRLAFVLVMVPALFGSFWLVVSLARPKIARSRQVLILLLCLLSWPVMFGLRLQQPTLIVAVLVLPACWLLSREHQIPAGILLALSTFKPQLVLPLLLWLLVWACFGRRWKLIAAFAVTETLYFAASEIMVPGWLSHWLADLHRYGALCANLPLQLIFGHAAGLLATIALVGYVFWRLWRKCRCSPQSPEFVLAIAVALAVSICTTPVTWGMIYNHVLLVPAALLLLFSARPSGSGVAALLYWITQALLVWTFASVAIAALGNLLAPSDIWIPMLFINHLLTPALILTVLSRPLTEAVSASSVDRNLAVSSAV